MIYKVPNCSQCPFRNGSTKCLIDEKRELDEAMLEDIPVDCVLKTEGLTFIADDDFDDEENYEENE